MARHLWLVQRNFGVPRANLPFFGRDLIKPTELNDLLTRLTHNITLQVECEQFIHDTRTFIASSRLFSDRCGQLCVQLLQKERQELVRVLLAVGELFLVRVRQLQQFNQRQRLAQRIPIKFLLERV